MMWSILIKEARNKMMAKRQAKKLGIEIRISLRDIFGVRMLRERLEGFLFPCIGGRSD